ncbi:malate dehydrogenase [Candidatus Woesearchaeota archaeon]|nr:malate dehydrogenase [Candidatus Woesearchaeota archaeon]
MKLSVVGAGNVGSQVALFGALKHIDEIILIDILGDMAKGKALDIQESMPIVDSHSTIIGGSDYGLTKGSDIVVITAGIARKPGMTRDNLINTNSNIMKSIIPEVCSESPNSIIIIVSNPLDAMVHLAYNLSKFPKNRVLGMAGVLDSARFRSFIAQELNVHPKLVKAMVLGGHGDSMVPVMSLCKVNDEPITKLLSMEKINQIIERVKSGGAEVVKLLKTGSAFFAPGASVIEMVESILHDQKKVMPCATMLEGEYGIGGVFAGVPVELGKNGVEKIIEIPLSDEELTAFKTSADHVKELTKNLNL